MFGKPSSLYISFAVIVVAYLFYDFNLIRSPVVTIKDGKLQGIVSLSRDGRKFYEYLGIPYSKPPLKKFRFEPPQPVDPWDGVKDVSSYSNRCVQLEIFISGIFTGSEDCLYLNVFVPEENPDRKPLPVMFYIHGGMFHIGSSEVAGPKNLMGEGLGVILVTINYRLGALGFMNSGDGLIRGNMGLKDQNMALQWVQANIHAFGGDATKVTIFGESAGAGSVHHHVLSPLSKGLFWKAIHQSGSSINYWGVFRDFKAQTRRFAKKFNCPVDNPKAMVSCLKEVDASTFVCAHLEMMSFFRTRISTFGPTIEIKDDKAFITEEPLEVLKSGRFNKVPLMAGFNSHEGLLITVLSANQTKLNEANDNWETWAPRKLHYPKNLTEVTSKLRKFYFGDETSLINDTKYFQNFTNLLGDRLFSIGTSRSAILQSKYVSTHAYYNEYKGEISVGAVMANTEGNLPFVINFMIHRLKVLFHRHILGEELPHMGTSHADEIGLLFSGRWFEGLIFSRNRDTQMSKDLVRLWSDFAKDIKPLKFRNIEWPTVKKDNVKFLRISNDPAIIDEPFEDRRKFWESLVILNY